MSEIYFLGTTRPLAHTRYSFSDIIPDLDGGGMLHGDGIIFEDNLHPDAIATGVDKILKGCHIYAVQTTFGLDYEARYKQVYSPQTAANMVKVLHWFKNFICSLITKGSKVCLIKLWQGKALSPKELKRQIIRTDEWLITGDSDVIFEYGTLYEFDYIPPAVAFPRKNMSHILEEFADCDSFSLTAIWKEGWLLTEEEAASALNVFAEECVSRCRREYEKFTDGQRGEYPDFNALWEQFGQKYSAVGREWRLLPDSPQKYKSYPKPDVPQFLQPYWACALELGIHEAEAALFRLVGTTPPEEVLNGEYAALKPHLIKVLPSFFHHCASSGVFRCHFVFALNKETKAWLAEYPDTDCFTMPLEDLALYSGGEIKLSCCSHEGICNKINAPRRLV